MSVPNSGMSVQFHDFYGRNVTRRYRLTPTALAALGTSVALVKNAVVVLSDAAIWVSRAWVRYAYAGASPAETNSNIDDGVTISLDLGNGRTAALKIPTPNNAVGVFNADGTLNMGNVYVTALEALFTGAAPRFVASDGEPVLGFLSGRLDT